MIQPTWTRIVLHTVKTYLPMIIFFGLVLISGAIEMRTARAESLQETQSVQEVQSTVKGTKLQPAAPTHVLMPMASGESLQYGWGN